MCIMPKAPSAPPPPPPVEIPKPFSTEAAPRQMQKGPEMPKDTLFARRGKRGMVIQMGASAGTNIPGQG